MSWGGQMPFKLSLAGLVLCASLVDLFLSAANADPVTSIPGGMLIPIPVLNIFTAGPETVAPGVTWTASSASAVYGSTVGYIASPLRWPAGTPAVVGTDIPGVSMTFTFSTPVSAVGGNLLWVTFFDPVAGTRAIISLSLLLLISRLQIPMFSTDSAKIRQISRLLFYQVARLRCAI
jgi:hypothetical protein